MKRITWTVLAVAAGLWLAAAGYAAAKPWDEMTEQERYAFQKERIVELTEARDKWWAWSEERAAQVIALKAQLSGVKARIVELERINAVMLDDDLLRIWAYWGSYTPPPGDLLQWHIDYEKQYREVTP